MGYYTRTFCTGTSVPMLATIQNWLRQRGSAAVLDEPNSAVEAARNGVLRAPVLDLNTADWNQIGIMYRARKMPILAECNRDDGTDDCLMRQEISQFIESIGQQSWSPKKRRVLKHLSATRFIIACQLPTSDIDDDGYVANDDFLNFFVENCGGMIQADAEGFYVGDKIILRTD